MVTQRLSIQDGAGDFRLLSRRCVDVLAGLTESNRFSKGLFAWIGYPATSVTCRNRDRAGDQSAWGFRSLVNYGIDGVVAFNDKPLRAAVHSGVWALLGFVAYVIWLVAASVMHGVEVPGYITTIAAIVGIGGMQLVFLGVVGEYVGRIYLEVKRRPHYLVAEDVRFTDSASQRAAVAAQTLAAQRTSRATGFSGPQASRDPARR